MTRHERATITRASSTEETHVQKLYMHKGEMYSWLHAMLQWPYYIVSVSLGITLV